MNRPAVRCRGNKGPSRRALAGVKSRGPTRQVRATLATRLLLRRSEEFPCVGKKV
jgi:hypothetical protein